MKKRQSPGISPLGHSPFGHEKLEGPKVHHDSHGSEASAPGKGNKPLGHSEHWEMHYDATAPSANMVAVEGAAFNPKCAKDRKTTYVKVNGVDH